MLVRLYAHPNFAFLSAGSKRTQRCRTEFQCFGGANGSMEPNAAISSQLAILQWTATNLDAVGKPLFFSN